MRECVVRSRAHARGAVCGGMGAGMRGRIMRGGLYGHLRGGMCGSLCGRMRGGTCGRRCGGLCESICGDMREGACAGACVGAYVAASAEACVEADCGGIAWCGQGIRKESRHVPKYLVYT